MKNVFLIVALTVFLFSLSCTNKNEPNQSSNDFTIEDATHFLDNYTSALATGDSTEVRRFWSDESLGREGFWFMHSRVGGRKIRFRETEGYDIKLNVGVEISISNQFGEVSYSTPDVYDKIANIKTNVIEFSVPIDFLGEPKTDWKYFVGVGLMNNRTMNFLHGGPMPVQNEHPVFISGGNFSYDNPAFIDILWPDKNEQTQLLGNYNPKKGIQPIIPMLSSIE